MQRTGSQRPMKQAQLSVSSHARCRTWLGHAKRPRTHMYSRLGSVMPDIDFEPSTSGRDGFEITKERRKVGTADLQDYPVIQWYPGHIAKAERNLKEQLSMVDVVLEVRDARIPAATAHPQLKGWISMKPKLLLLNRKDMISDEDKAAWADHFASLNQKFFWTDGKSGQGVQAVKKELMKVGKVINARREQKGLLARPVRACVVGFPNIGKSALINRLLSKSVVASAPMPGVTRVLRWIRVNEDVDLLDSPGILPTNLTNRRAAHLLAVCNDIGEASYVDSLVAAAFIQLVRQLPRSERVLQAMHKRYKVDPREGTSEDVVVKVAQSVCLGDVERAAARILKDYRKCVLGSFALELPEIAT